MSKPRVPRPKAHIPAQSVFYDKVIPALLIGMALATAIFIVIAAGVLLGFVPFK
jgi:hypothetical protein